MTITASAIAMESAGAAFQPTMIERRDPGPQDVVIDIAYVGVCHSDIHTGRDEWSGTHFPLTPGHEITGVVSALGTEVTTFAIGDRVGVGCFVDSCRQCESCLRGEEQYCTEGVVYTYNSQDHDGAWTQGGYSTRIVVDEAYVLRIPDSLALDAAAPLLCAGVTLYAPLRRWSAGIGKRVAIVGMGGLGHIGVKIAHAMGAHVTVLSQSLSKQADGLAFGADEYFTTAAPETFDTLSGSFDLLISTLSVDYDVDAYLSLVKAGGAMVFVGMPSNSQSLSVFSLASARRILAGSNIGGIRENQEMLEFCAEHGITAEIEVISADETNDAWNRVIASDVRYRFVIDAATISAV